MDTQDKNIMFTALDLMSSGVVSRRSLFIQTENVFINNPRYTVYEKMVYLNLCTYAGRHTMCFPSQETIAKDLGITRMMTSKVLKKLQELGGIYIVNQVKENGRKTSNLYFLADIDQVTGDFIPNCETIQLGKSLPNPRVCPGV